MRSLIVTLFCVLTCFASSLVSHAEDAAGNGDADALIKAYAGKDPAAHAYALIHADLIAQGLSSANAYVTYYRKDPALYCQPMELALTGEQVMDILKRAVEKDAALGHLSTGSAILRALQRTFPCQK